MWLITWSGLWKGPIHSLVTTVAKKAFIEGTVAKLSQVLPKGAQLHVVNWIVKDDEAVVFVL
jgi:hypothetical protein